MTAAALAVSSALAALVAALLFAIRARDAERAYDDAVRSRDLALRRAHAAELTAREWSDRCAETERKLERTDRELAEADAELVRRWNLGNVEAARECVERVRAAASDYANVARLLVQLADAHPDEIVRGVPCETPHRARIVSLAFLDVLRFHAPAELGRAIFSPVPPGIHPLPLDLAIIYRENEAAALDALHAGVVESPTSRPSGRVN